MEVLKNRKNLPLAIVGKTALVTVYDDTSKKLKKSATEKAHDWFEYKNVKYVPWGDDNNWPERSEEIVGSIGVLNTGIDYRCRTCAGNGVVPVTLKGIDEKFREIYEPYSDLDVIQMLNSHWFRLHQFDALRDLFKLGNAFTTLVFNNANNKIVRVDTLNARHCRLSVNKDKLLVYNDFANGGPDETAWVLPMLDERDPLDDLMWRKDTGRLDGIGAIAFPRMKNYFSNNDYYARPAWDAVKKAGWLDVYREVPKFLKTIYTNAMSLMWHVNVPYSYIEEKFREEKYASMTDEERNQEYNRWMDDIEKNLCSCENANKAFFTPYLDDAQGRGDGKWQITKLDSTASADEKLTTSVAANSEILFSLMINPSVLGAGMPGGAYAGNSGSGSDIREAFMVSVFLNYFERQLVLDPVESMLRFNGHKNIDIKYRNLLLSTLDTGHSSEEKIS